MNYVVFNRRRPYDSWVCTKNLHTLHDMKTIRAQKFCHGQGWYSWEERQEWDFEQTYYAYYWLCLQGANTYASVSCFLPIHFPFLGTMQSDARLRLIVMVCRVLQVVSASELWSTIFRNGIDYSSTCSLQKRVWQSSLRYRKHWNMSSHATTMMMK